MALKDLRRRSRCQFYVSIVIILLINFFNSSDCKGRGDSILDEIVNRRHIRSPFAPPIVTALHPNRRTEKPKVDLVIRVKDAHNVVMHPIANSQAIFTKKPSTYETHRKYSQINGNSDSSYVPIATTEDKRKNGPPQHLSLMLQNDQSLITEPVKLVDLQLSQAEIAKKEREDNDDESGQRDMQFKDLNHVLRTINKTSSELMKLLNGSFHEFLEFVENGATEEEILNFIRKKKMEMEQNAKLAEQKKYKKRKKKFRLRDLPYQEKVHKIQIEKHYYGNDNLVRDKTLKFPYKGSYEPERIPRDSPMVTHLSKSGPIEISNEITKVAHIISTSMTIDKGKKKPNGQVISKYNSYARSKISSTDDDSSGPHPHMYGSDEVDKDGEVTNDVPSSYQQLRLVFPIKGILVFCGILGSIALVTVLLLIIYGSVKCSKQKPISNNYKVNDRIELTDAQCQ